MRRRGKSRAILRKIERRPGQLFHRIELECGHSIQREVMPKGDRVHRCPTCEDRAGNEAPAGVRQRFKCVGCGLVVEGVLVWNGDGFELRAWDKSGWDGKPAQDMTCYRCKAE